MFYFKGISNMEMSLIPEEEDFTGRAQIRTEEIVIEGRNGSIFKTLGYANVTKNVKFTVLDQSKIDDIYSWLTGDGIFEYNNRITTACFFDPIEAKRVGSIKTIDVTFIRYPFWVSSIDSFITVKDYIINSGNISSQPIIKLSGKNGTHIELKIGDVRFGYTFDEAEFVEVNCENKTELASGASKSKLIEIGFNYPSLKPGMNDVILYEGMPKIEVKRKDRWL